MTITRLSTKEARERYNRNEEMTLMVVEMRCNKATGEWQQVYDTKRVTKFRKYDRGINGGPFGVITDMLRGKTPMSYVEMSED